jgi:hypothetical protein
MSLAQTETPPILPRTLIQGIVEAICDRPGDTPEQRDERSRDVVEAVQGFGPRDPVEAMLAGLAVLHAHLIQDSARDLLREQDNRVRSRTKSAIAALDRGMLGFLRELRVARKRPLGTDKPHQDHIAKIDTAELVASPEASANVMEPHQVPEPEIVVLSPPPIPSLSPHPSAATPASPSVTPSVSAKPSGVATLKTQPPPFARLPLTAKARRQQTKALKILARRAAAANRAQTGQVAPAVTAPGTHAG